MSARTGERIASLLEPIIVMRAGGAHGVMASTRNGLPEPLTIFKGAAITMAPVAGSWSRLHREARPNLPLPCMMQWFENGGSKVEAMPASVPTVSTPTPRMSRCFARNSEHSLVQPGWWGPSLPRFKYSAADLRFDQPVRSSTQDPGAMG